jgi:hypothetical protein
MKLNHLFTLVIAILITANLFSQTIVGKIIDEQENPIAYASIQVAKKGVLSNEEGEFLINTNQFKKNDKVTISFLGFKKLELLVKELENKTYILKEELNELSEVFITNKKLSLDEILLKMKENLSSNYTDTPNKQQIFNRNTYFNKFKRFEFEIKKSTLLTKKELKKLNFSIDSLINNNLNKTSKYYTETLSNLVILKDSAKINVIKSTQLINKKEDVSQEAIQKLFFHAIAGNLDKDATYKVKSGLLPVTDSLKFEIDKNKDIYKDSTKSDYKKNYYKSLIKNYTFKKESPLTFVTNTKKYNYKLKGTIDYEDEFVYVVNFTPKSSSAKFSGTMYINGYDFAIVKLDFGFAKNRTGKGVNLKLLLGVKYKNNLWKSSVLYKKNALETYNLYFLKQEQGNYVYMSRPFKIKKNKASKAEAKKLIKLDVLMELSTKDKTELYFIDESNISNDDFNNFKENKKYKVEYISKYTPEIWKGYNVLSPVNEIKNYDTGE